MLSLYNPYAGNRRRYVSTYMPRSRYVYSNKRYSNIPRRTISRAISNASDKNCAAKLRKKLHYTVSKRMPFKGVPPLIYAKPNKGYVVLFEMRLDEENQKFPLFHGVWKESNITGMAKYAIKQKIGTPYVYDSTNARIDISKLITAQRATLAGLAAEGPQAGAKRVQMADI